MITAVLIPAASAGALAPQSQVLIECGPPPMTGMLLSEMEGTESYWEGGKGKELSLSTYTRPGLEVRDRNPSQHCVTATPIPRDCIEHELFLLQLHLLSSQILGHFLSCSQVRHVPGAGRSIYATRAYAAGDVVLVEDAVTVGAPSTINPHFALRLLRLYALPCPLPNFRASLPSHPRASGSTHLTGGGGGGSRHSLQAPSYSAGHPPPLFAPGCPEFVSQL